MAGLTRASQQIAGSALVVHPEGCRRPIYRPLTVAASSAKRQAAPPDESLDAVDVPQLNRRALLAAATCAASSVALAPLTAVAADDDGFQTAPNGLAWKDTKEGEGPAPTAGASIRCNYTGRLASSGSVFDSSYGRRPLSFKIGVRQVIQGWDLGILGDAELGVPPMKEGGKRTLRIPAALGYGARGAGGVIPPNSDLVFDVELLAKRPGF